MSALTGGQLQALLYTFVSLYGQCFGIALSINAWFCILIGYLNQLRASLSFSAWRVERQVRGPGDSALAAGRAFPFSNTEQREVEEGAIVSLITTLLVAVVFVGYVLPRYPAGNAYSTAVFHFWGWAVVILIPVSIVANIVMNIVFRIVYAIATQEKTTSIADERDQFIELRATRNAIYVFTCGFFLAMGSLAIGMPPSVMFIVLMSFGYGAGLVLNLSQIYLYRKGC